MVNGEMNNNNLVFVSKAKQSLTCARQGIARKSCKDDKAISIYRHLQHQFAGVESPFPSGKGLRGVGRPPDS